MRDAESLSPLPPTPHPLCHGAVAAHVLPECAAGILEQRQAQGFVRERPGLGALATASLRHYVGMHVWYVPKSVCRRGTDLSSATGQHRKSPSRGVSMVLSTVVDDAPPVHRNAVRHRAISQRRGIDHHAVAWACRTVCTVRTSNQGKESLLQPQRYLRAPICVPRMHHSFLVFASEMMRCFRSLEGGRVQYSSTHRLMGETLMRPGTTTEYPLCRQGSHCSLGRPAPTPHSGRQTTNDMLKGWGWG